MISKNQIKFINSLKQKKYRNESGLFTVEGTRMISELADTGLKIDSLFATADWMKEHEQSTLKRSGVAAIEISENDLKKISNLTTPHQVLAVVNIPSYYINNHIVYDNLSLVLDKVSDPGNLGAIIRSADWFGIENIYCSQGTVDAYNPKVVQASMGSVFRTAVHVVDLPDFLWKVTSDDVQFPVYGTVFNGDNLYDCKLSSKGLIVMGSEAGGISPDVLQFVNKKITIPSFGKAESLNVAAAAAVICAEFRRKGR